MNLKTTISKPMYDLLKFYTNICYEQKEDATYFGVRLLEEQEKFVRGNVFNACAKLCCYYYENNQKEFDFSVQKLHFAVDLLREQSINTWGKISLLRGICSLYKKNLLSLLDEDELAIVKERGRYDDFLDVETVSLKGYPSNYYQVAMAIAGMREMLGWDKGNTSEKIRDKLFSIMTNFSDTGWMDENPPFGRFDRYSIVISSELADTLISINREVPESTKENLKKAYKLALACANPKGDGVVYGRSLSVHGDCAFLEIISTALRLGLVDKEDIDLALAYSCAIVQKTTNYWFDQDRNSFNIWFDGRTTNNYRQVRRLLEVNTDMAFHMLTTLDNFDAAGYADVDIPMDLPKSPYDFGNPYKVVFVNEENKQRILYCFVHNERLIQLPLVGIGNVRRASSYLPFPAMTGELEGSPEAQIPWLIPEFIGNDGKVYVPYAFYTDIEDINTPDSTTIIAKGNLSSFDEKGVPVPSEYSFTTTYTFNKDTITMNFKTNLESKSRVFYPKREGATVQVSCNGKLTLSNIDTNPLYYTPHGRSNLLYEWNIDGNDVTLNVKL